MARVSRYALASLGVASVVLALKAFAYWVTGSVALLSDALESIINVVVAGIAFFTLQVSVQPADANHPFGHHKAEYFSAGLEGTLITVAALLIFREAYFAFLLPKALTQPALGLAVNGVASSINLVWGWWLLRLAMRERSPALKADAKHILADVVSSVGVIVGVGLASFTGIHSLDAVVACLAGAYILVSGWRLIRESVGGLMDQAVDAEKLETIRECISKEAVGAIEAHDLQTRRAGPVTFIQFHLVVPADMTVSTAHDICDRIEEKLLESVVGARITIHIEPENKAKHSGIVVL